MGAAQVETAQDGVAWQVPEPEFEAGAGAEVNPVPEAILPANSRESLRIGVVQDAHGHPEGQVRVEGDGSEGNPQPGCDREVDEHVSVDPKVIGQLRVPGVGAQLTYHVEHGENSKIPTYRATPCRERPAPVSSVRASKRPPGVACLHPIAPVQPPYLRPRTAAGPSVSAVCRQVPRLKGRAPALLAGLSPAQPEPRGLFCGRGHWGHRLVEFVIAAGFGVQRVILGRCGAIARLGGLARRTDSRCSSGAHRANERRCLGADVPSSRCRGRGRLGPSFEAHRRPPARARGTGPPKASVLVRRGAGYPIVTSPSP